MEDYAEARAHMVASQVHPNDVTDPRLLDAMREMPREAFVPARLKSVAYIDEDLPLTEPGDGAPRYLMEPMPFARLVHLARVKPGDLVLDVGCATGYSSAILSRLADSVVALESDETLAARANEILPELEIGNVAVVTGPLNEGYPGEGPFDVIVVNGQVPQVPESLLRQLKAGGRLVTIVGAGRGSQAWLYLRDNDDLPTGRAAFNASAKPLPGFEEPPVFSF